jgi:chitinase
VTFSGVNLMTMDFNQAQFANGYSQDGASNDMAYYTEQSATAVVGQLRGLEPGLTSQQAWGMIGLIPEVGANDGADANEVFDTTNAAQLESWAQGQGVGELSMWSVQRDGWDYSYGVSQAFNRFGHS